MPFRANVLRKLGTTPLSFRARHIVLVCGVATMFSLKFGVLEWAWSSLPAKIKCRLLIHVCVGPCVPLTCSPSTLFYKDLDNIGRVRSVVSFTSSVLIFCSGSSVENLPTLCTVPLNSLMFSFFFFSFIISLSRRRVIRGELWDALVGDWALRYVLKEISKRGCNRDFAIGKQWGRRTSCLLSFWFRVVFSTGWPCGRSPS